MLSGMVIFFSNFDPPAKSLLIQMWRDDFHELHVGKSYKKIYFSKSYYCLYQILFNWILTEVICGWKMTLQYRFGDIFHSGNINEKMGMFYTFVVWNHDLCTFWTIMTNNCIQNIISWKLRVYKISVFSKDESVFKIMLEMYKSK